MKATTIDIAQMTDLRDHYLTEARKVDDALAVIKNINRLARTAAKTMGKVRTRAAAEAAPMPTKKKQKRRVNGSVSVSQRQRQMRAAGTRPTDVLRRIFVEAGTKTMSQQQLLDLSGFVGAGGPHKTAAGNGARLLGLALHHLVAGKEVKKTGEGYVARKLQLPEANGAHA